MNEHAQLVLDRENAKFWNHLCGSAQARVLGISDSSAPSLKRFDDWYFEFYPYLVRHIPISQYVDRRVLEVGLGYGSIAQRIAESGAEYHGIDISAGPVAMVNHRLRQARLSGNAVQASILSCPYPDAYFDCVVAIGCYHHTGNLQRALDETYRVLKPGGCATVMVYNINSYYRWIKWPMSNLRYAMWRIFGAGNTPSAAKAERAAHDIDEVGRGAPETRFVSTAEIGEMTTAWSSVSIYKENVGRDRLALVLSRDFALRTLGRLAGLDLYCRLTK